MDLRAFTDKQLDRRLTQLENTYLTARDWWEQNTIKRAYHDVLAEKERRKSLA